VPFFFAVFIPAGAEGSTIILMLFAVLTVSDRCSQGLLKDTAGPAVVVLLGRHWEAAEIRTGLVPDDEDRIAAALERLSGLGAALVLTVGGTGLGPRDRTPEATRRVIDREAPGLAEAMRALGAGRNPLAWLSRGVAGLKGNTLIVNLPGSRRGAEESLEAIVALLKHGLEIAAGGQTHP
jgi:molybdenum cofactor synthesis domain-containing protein